MAPIKSNVADEWVKTLHFEPKDLVKQFKAEMLGVTEVLVNTKSVPFNTQSAPEIASKLKSVSQALEKAVEELRYLKVYDGQDLEECPANLPVILAVETAHAELCNENKKMPDLDKQLEFVTARVEGVEELLSCVNRAIKNMSRRGNSSLRSHESQMKSQISKNFVFKYRATFGHYPTQRKDVVEVLGWLFEAAGLANVNAEGSLRTAIENDQNWLGGKNSELVRNLIARRKSK